MSFRISHSNEPSQQSNQQSNDQSFRFADIHARLSPVSSMTYDPSNDQSSPSIPLADYAELPPQVKAAMLQMNDQLNSQQIDQPISQPNTENHDHDLNPQPTQSVDYAEVPESVESSLNRTHNQQIALLDDEYSELPSAVRDALIKQSMNQTTSPSPDDDEYSELPESVRQMMLANGQSTSRSASPAPMPDYAEMPSSRPKSLSPAFSIKASSSDYSLGVSIHQAKIADVDSPRSPSVNHPVENQPTTPVDRSPSQTIQQQSLSATQPVKPQPPPIGSSNHNRSHSASPSVNHQTNSNQLGSLHVQVCKATGKAFESGIKIIIALTVGQSSSNQSSNQLNQAVKQSTNPRKHPLGSKKKPVVWDESFTFAIYQHATTLQVDCFAANSTMTQINNPSVKPSHNQPIGSVSINLSTLPQAKSVKKWYELKRQGESIGVVQLILTHHLIYQLSTPATHRHNQSINQSMNHSILNHAHSGSLTQVPSHHAREAIRKAIIAQSMNQSMRKQYRFIDYFCIIGVENPTVSEPSAQSVNQPKILSRFPLLDRSDVSLPAEIGMFCFPNGYHLADKWTEPKCFSFRLSADMDQMMVTCLCFWTEQSINQSGDQADQLPKVQINDDFILPHSDTPHVFERSSAQVNGQSRDQSIKLYVPRVLMITSRLSYVPQYREILISIYHHFYAPNDLPTRQLPCAHDTSSSVGGLSQQLNERADSEVVHESCILQCEHQTIRLDCCGRSLEDYLVYLCEEVPLPTPGGQSLNLLVNCRSVSLSLPASELDFPSLEFDLVDCLFDCLDFDSILLILRCLLSEFRAIFWSSNASLCHSISDLLINLLYPFQWSHIYIPLLPDSLMGILDAPVSYVVGIQSLSQPNIQSINDTTNLVMIDIDRGIVDLCIPPPPLPVQSIKILKNSIRKLIRPKVFTADSINPSPSRSSWHSPSEAELKHADCLHGNRSELALSRDSPSPDDKHAKHSTNGHFTQSYDKSSIDQTIQQRNRAIRYEFFHFWSSLIHGYRDHLYFINGSVPTFDVPSFLANQSTDHSNESSAFLSKLVGTQLFRDFLDRHVEMPSYLSDYLTYLTPEPVNQCVDQHNICQRPARSLAEWSELVHSNDEDTQSVVADDYDDEHDPSSGRSDKLQFSATSPLTSTVCDLDHDDFTVSETPTISQPLSRAQSTVRDRSSSQPGDGCVPFSRPAVLSLAPAVAPFLSSQTIVTALSPQVAQRNLPVNQIIPQAISEVINPTATAINDSFATTQVQYFKPWMFPEPRSLNVADAQQASTPSISQSISSLKNPATLLHMPIALNCDQSEDEMATSDQTLSRSVTFDGDSLSIAIRTPERRPSFAQIHDHDQSVNQLDESPFSSPDLSPTPYDPNQSASQTPRNPRSRAGSLLIRQPSNPTDRVQSTNLLSKSELEKKRSPAQQRLGLLLESLMSKHSHSLIDVGELSGVIELLSLREWRDQLVALIGQQYGLYDQSNNQSSNHRFIRPDAFSAMLLLFNGALEECQADGDYTCGYILMQLSARLYTHAQAINQSGHEMTAMRPMQLSSFQERVYLIQSIKKHRLWSVSALWDLGYSAEVHRIRHGVWPRQSCDQCKLENEQPMSSPDHQSVEDEEEWRRVEASRAAAERAELAESCFEAMVFLVNTMASLDCHRSFIEFFIEQSCCDDENISDKQAILIQLAHNSTAAQQALVRPSMQQSVSLTNNHALQPRIINQSSLPGRKNLEKYQLAQREFQLEDL